VVLPGTGMKTFAHNLTIPHDYGTDKGIGGSFTPRLLGEDNTPLHHLAIEWTTRHREKGI
jgi:hypothetical protein